jgi:uncharacterized heparinase superfamily protein
MIRLGQIQRAYAFGRYIPPRRMARRIALDLKRRWLQTSGGRALHCPTGWTVTPTPPEPIFPARLGKFRHDGPTLTLTFLNRSESFTHPIDWHRHRGDRARQLWSMNLHYMEFLEGCDDATFERLVMDWLIAARPYDLGYWRDAWNSYAVSLRVVVWMQQLVARPNIPATLRDRMNRSLVGQIAFLAHNLETDLGGNHLIKNIKALLWGSVYFAGPQADGWKQQGLALLSEALTEQVLADGVHFERSPSYHAQVFANLLECRAALGSDPLGGRLDTALASMAQAVADLTQGDGGPALFNDAGLTMCYSPQTCLTAHARQFGQCPAPRTRFAYHTAGFFGLCDTDSHFIADCGPIGADTLPAHAHGDVLSFEWSARGQRIIVDQGVFEYVAGERRSMSRSCVSHNTLALEGLDQADFFADFRVGRRPDVRVRHYQTTPTGFVLEGTHSGFADRIGKPVHVRRFDVAPRAFTIHDKIEGVTDRGARISFLLHPDVKFDAAKIHDEAGDHLRIHTFSHQLRLTCGPLAFHLQSTDAISVEDAVWWPDMGVEFKTKRLVIKTLIGNRTVTTRWSIDDQSLA